MSWLVGVSAARSPTFSLGFVARDILTGIAETGRGKQTLYKNERHVRQDTETAQKRNIKK